MLFFYRTIKFPDLSQDLNDTIVIYCSSLGILKQERTFSIILGCLLIVSFSFLTLALAIGFIPKVAKDPCKWSSKFHNFFSLSQTNFQRILFFFVFVVTELHLLFKLTRLIISRRWNLLLSRQIKNLRPSHSFHKYFSHCLL